MSITPFAIVTTACLLIAAPAAAQASDDRPALPDGFAASFAAPTHDPAGYRTPNRELSAEEAVWHVRVALNVAALGCRDAAEPATVAAYNALLATQAPALAAADAGAQAQERARFGADWQQRHDDEQTRLYNFWAQPPAQAGFCAVAEQVLRESASVEPGDLPGFAADVLPRLESPFIAAYAAWDSYRAQVAAWQARQAPVVVTAAVRSAPVIAVPAFAPAVPMIDAPSVVAIASAVPSPTLLAMASPPRSSAGDR